MKTIGKRWVSLVLAAMLVAGTIVPSFAAVGSASTGAVETSSVEKVSADDHAYARRINYYDYDITFDVDVITDEHLSASLRATRLKATGYRNKVKIKWTESIDKSAIDGYIIARKDTKGERYRQIATYSRNATQFTYKNSLQKDKFYCFTVIAYKKVGDKIMISRPAIWAGAVILGSKKKNVYKVEIDNCASVSAVAVGKGTTPEISFRKKAYSKEIRWYSKNKSIATVSSTGRIKGIRTGTTKIVGRTHAGRFVSTYVTVFNPGTAQSMIDVMNSWMGYSYYNGKHQGIVDIYNSMYPLPVGYKLGFWDAWCDASISAAAIVTGNADRTGRECSVPRHIKIFKQKGIWIEGNKTVPKPGDLIVFNWFPALKNNASHIGIVAKVEGNTITTIEGNMGIGKVDTRTIQVGWKYIRGYARPKYLTKVTSSRAN